MPVPRIICVKIAQRVLEYPKGHPKSPYTYFPYDRVYLAPKELTEIFKKLFRYYLIMDLDRDLFVALNALAVKNINRITVIRDDKKKEGELAPKQNAIKQLIHNHVGWVMVVPTHVRSKYDKDKDPPVYASSLRYTLSAAVVRGHNENVKVPPIKLITPTRQIPFFCGVCLKAPSFHAGECAPGRPSCRAEIDLKPDLHHYQARKRSIKETGGVS